MTDTQLLNHKIPSFRLKSKVSFVAFLYWCASVFSGCTSYSDNNLNSVLVTRLNADADSALSSLIAESGSVNGQHSGAILNLDLIRNSGWFKIEVRTPRNDIDYYLDTGPTPMGVRQIILQHEPDTDQWEIITDKNIRNRYIGPLPSAKDGLSTLYLQLDSPLPIKAILSLTDSENIYKKNASENYFRIVIIMLILFFISHNIFFYFLSFDILYIYLACFYFFIIGYFSFYSGTVFLLPFPLPHYHLLYLSVSFGLIFLNAFIDRLFHFRQRSGILHRILHWQKKILILQMILFIAFQREMFTAYFVTGFNNTLILSAAAFIVMIRGVIYEKVIGFILLITQILSFLATIYLSGLVDLLHPELGTNLLLFEFIHFSGMIVMFGMVGALFFSSLAARYSTVYNQMQIVEDDGNDLPREIVNSRINIASRQNMTLKDFSEEEIQTIRKNLDDLFINMKIYRDPDLDLNALAEIMNIQPWRLSLFLNNYINKSFRVFVTENRIADVIKCFEEKTDYPILRIAYDAGFDSKSSFNRAFQKYKGMTPSEYRRQISG